ncbi:MAG: hypothetical protein U5L96_10915 [Owenweeksia sp.]|nr:hypothetical protein [Owenweeksia sp.]
MYWLELTPRPQIYNSDHQYMATLPLLPYRFIHEKQGGTLALHGPGTHNEEGPYDLQTDHEGFYNSFKKYYEERFEVVEPGVDFSLPAGYQLLQGQVASAVSTRDTENEKEKV